MKDNKHIKKFNEHQENLNISDVSNRLSENHTDKQKENIRKNLLKYKEEVREKLNDIETYLSNLENSFDIETENDDRLLSFAMTYKSFSNMLGNVVLK